MSRTAAHTNRAVTAARIVLAVLLLSVCVFIFVLSSQNGTQSEDTSIGITRAVANCLFRNFEEKSAEEQEAVLADLHAGVRSFAHFAEYALLGLLSALFAVTFEVGGCPTAPHAWHYLLSCLSAVVYAVTDEVHQSFVAGRVADIADVGTDACGAIVGTVFAVSVAWLAATCKRRRLDKKKKV